MKWSRQEIWGDEEFKIESRLALMNTGHVVIIIVNN